MVQGMSASLTRLSAVQLAMRLQRREITAEALLRECIARIDEREALVGAWQHLDRHAALTHARALDGGAIRGPLHGLPIAVKDIIDTADMPTGHGSLIYAGQRPVADAACVAIARLAGAVVVGKTVTTEFASFFPGKTANPRNLAHTPGGSSSGSAAAVADGMVPLAFATQTAASIVRPASFCGIVGYKPSFGWLNRAGIKPFADSLDTLGAFATDVASVAWFAAALSGREALRLVEEPAVAAPRIGICRTHEWSRITIEAQAALEQIARRLAPQAQVTDVHLDERFAGLVDDQHAVMTYEASRAFAYERMAHGDRLSAKIREVFAHGDGVTHAGYDQALRRAEQARAGLLELWQGCDVLLAPSALGEAPEGLGATGDPLMSRMWTLLGVPCVNLPAGLGGTGLPLGVQVIGPIRGDLNVLRAAHWIEARIG